MEVKKQLATKKEIIGAINELFTHIFYKELITYSIIRMDKKFNIKYDVNRGFRGIMIEDIINNLMYSFLQDKGRNWNKAKFPNFKNQVYSALDSQIYNTIQKELEKTIKTNTIIIIENNDLNISNENDNYEELLNSCFSYLEKLDATADEILLLEPLIIYKIKRSVIAKEFGISEQEVTNIKKRLDRKIPALQKHLKSIIL